MNFNNKYDFLLIDKVDDFHYFKNLKDIAQYLDISISSAQNIQRESKKHLYWRHRASGYYIQRLFNNSNTNQPKENEMIFLYDAKERYKHIKNNSHWNRTMSMTS